MLSAWRSSSSFLCRLLVEGRNAKRASAISSEVRATSMTGMKTCKTVWAIVATRLKVARDFSKKAFSPSLRCLPIALHGFPHSDSQNMLSVHFHFPDFLCDVRMQCDD